MAEPAGERELKGFGAARGCLRGSGRRTVRFVSARETLEAQALLHDNENLRERQRALGLVLRALARGRGLQPVLDEVVDAAVRLCGGEYGSLYLAEGDVLRAFSHFIATDSESAVAKSAPEQWRLDAGRLHPRDRTTIAGRVALSGHVVHLPDMLADREYSFPLPGGSRAGIGVPIVVESELIGVIVVVRALERPFDDDSIELVKAFADQAAIAIANARLMDAVERQRSELSRFVSPQVAELISSEDGEKMLVGHRAYVTSMFCDLRGFTSFTETAEPEELFEVLREYHLALGELIPRYQGMLEHFAGDGLMVFFNDPVPVDDHELKAVQLALAAQERFQELNSSWSKRGYELGLGVGIASGYATLGRIGFEGRYDYGVLGTVTNLASRLSTHAEPGQTLISQRVYAAIEERVEALQLGGARPEGFRATGGCLRSAGRRRVHGVSSPEILEPESLPAAVSVGRVRAGQGLHLHLRSTGGRNA